MERDEVKRAITRLRTLKRTAAGRASREYAARLLPAAARYNTPADLAALTILSLALYYAAATRTAEDHAVSTLCCTIEHGYRALQEGSLLEDVLHADFDYPEELQQQLRATHLLPRMVVIAGIEAVRQVVLPLLL